MQNVKQKGTNVFCLDLYVVCSKINVFVFNIYVLVCISSGVWNVPYVSGCYLIRGTLIRQPETKPSYTYNQLDADMAFCANMREKVSKHRDSLEYMVKIQDTVGFPTVPSAMVVSDPAVPFCGYIQLHFMFCMTY